MEQADMILETSGICKSFGSIEALKNISLRFADRKIYGLFGRNGAGKTTLLNILSSRLFADGGSVTCRGEDISAYPGIIADKCCYMPEKQYFPARLKVRELLSHGAGSFPEYDEQYAHKLCRIFKLNTEQKYGQLSRGYQSIFRIVLGLAARATITIFDEPVLGLDAVARDQFYSELIEEFSRDQRLFIISTHLIDESANLYNEVVIINEGEVIHQASGEDLFSHAYYVSGKSTRIAEFVKNREMISCQTVNDIKTAVVKGDLSQVEPSPGLHFSTVTIQKLFIHLTHDNEEQE